MIGSNADFTRRLRQWYRKHRRDLPWRLPLKSSPKNSLQSNPNTKLNPYHVMVSEAMLQQTQVATVIPYFRRFIEEFPTLKHLADADTQQVLRAWQGLGYYSRARNLQSAAKKILLEFGGRVPSKVSELLELPGVGRYTAGAISSIAFEQRSPILDGNVARVLCRIDAVCEDPRNPAVREKLWKRAEEILPPSGVGDFNSSLMELGALVCSPRSPQCLICPVQAHCSACALGLADQIPPAKSAKKTLLHQRWTFCIRSGDRLLVQQRPDKGRWAAMWQFATIEASDGKPDAKFLLNHFGINATEPVLLGVVEHALTHRRYSFDVFVCQTTSKTKGDWLTLSELSSKPMPRPQLKIREMLLADGGGKAS